MGFVMNYHNPYVANKMVNGSQTTVTWHVDNLKVSLVNPQEGITFCLSLSSFYGKGLIVTRGKVHTYIGKYFDYSTDKEVKGSMVEYAKQIEEDFLEAIIITAHLSAAVPGN